MRRICGLLRFGLVLLTGSACAGFGTACSHPPPAPEKVAPPAGPAPGSFVSTFRAQKEAYHGKWTATTLEQERKVLENRTRLLNARAMKVTAQKPDRLVVEAHGVANPEQALQKLQTTASLQFIWLQQLGNENGTRRAVWRVVATPAAGGKGTEPQLTDMTTGSPVSADELERNVFSQPPIISNKDLLPKCRARMLSGPVIEFELNKEGADSFKAFTRHHIGERVGIFLDKKLLTALTVNGVIKGKGMIEGGLTLETAQTAADQLNAGPLPVPLTLIETQPLAP
ncbi:MAG TPA: hypothetical protein VKU00_34710 [Chthonomonadaceae bacterium]|nr:hypothetical protein [Chthonomonadaceae bacterium]